MAKMGMKGAQFHVSHVIPNIAGVSPSVRRNIVRLKPRRMNAMPKKPMQVSYKRGY